MYKMFSYDWERLNRFNRKCINVKCMNENVSLKCINEM